MGTRMLGKRVMVNLARSNKEIYLQDRWWTLAFEGEIVLGENRRVIYKGPIIMESDGQRREVTAGDTFCLRGPDGIEDCQYVG